MGGDRGDWIVVRSKKRKAMQTEAGRQDRSAGLERRGGAVQVRVRDQRVFVAGDRRSRHSYDSDVTSSKVSFYFTNFPEFMTVSQLRQH